jgi:hypothetical protein
MNLSSRSVQGSGTIWIWVQRQIIRCLELGTAGEAAGQLLVFPQAPLLLLLLLLLHLEETSGISRRHHKYHLLQQQQQQQACGDLQLVLVMLAAAAAALDLLWR